MSQRMNWKKFYINNCIDSNDELKEIDIKIVSVIILMI